MNRRWPLTAFQLQLYVTKGATEEKDDDVLVLKLPVLLSRFFYTKYVPRYPGTHFITFLANGVAVPGSHALHAQGRLNALVQSSHPD